MKTLLIEGVSAPETGMYEALLALSPSDTFMITTQDGYDAGLLTPEDLSRVPDEAARHNGSGDWHIHL